MTGASHQFRNLNPLKTPMKKTAIQILTALAAVALSTASTYAAGTDTWQGNQTDANWNTAANWSPSAAPVNGDSLVFGAAGTAGTTLNNNITSLLVNKLTFNSGASSFIFGGNSFTLGTGGIDASALTSGTMTFTPTTTIGNGLQKWNVGAGATLAFGSLGAGADAADLYTPNGAMVIISSTGTIKTTTADGWGWRNGAVAGTGPLGPGMVIDNGNNTYDWASVGTQTAGTSHAIVAATYTSAVNGDAHNVKVTGNTTVNPNASWASLLVSGATLTANTGGTLSIDTGIILQNGGTVAGSCPIRANADGLYIYVPDSGTISSSLQNNGVNAKLLYKAGPGTLSLTGNNSYTVGTKLYAGTLSVGNASALGSGALTISGGNLDCSSANLTLNNNIAQNWNADFTFVGTANLNLGSGAVTLGATRQVTVINTLTVGGVIGDGSNGYGLTKAGSGTLKLAGANTYTGATTVNAGTLEVGTAGTGIASGSATTVNSTGTLLVDSGATVGSSTVAVSGGTISGAGIVSGNTTINSSGALTPRPSGGSATTLTFGGNLTLSSASANLTLSTSAAGSNDKVNYGSSGTLTLGNSDTINITGTTFDTASDYTLITSTSGTVSMATTPALYVNGTLSDQTSVGKYKLLISGHSLVLHYIQAALPPTVNSVSAVPSSLGHYQTTLVTVNVTPASGQSITSVTVGLDGLGGAGDPVTLTGPGGNGAGNWTGTFTASGTLTNGNYLISGLVNQSDLGSSPWSVVGGVTVTNLTQVWNGLGTNNNWSTGSNWVSGVRLGAGDSAVMAGSTQVTNNLDSNLSIAALTFNSNAGSFDITNAANTLTLTAGVTNNSTNAQILDVPVALSAAQNINVAAGNVAINRAVSDSGAGFTLLGTNTLTLSGTNTYSGATTIGAGTLAIGGAGQLGSGTYSALITNNGALNRNSSAAQTLSGTISGTGSLTNSGSGTLTLSSAGSTYSGGTTLSTGQITLGASSAGAGSTVTNGPLGTGTVTLSGGTLQLKAQTLGNNLVAAASTSSILDNSVNNSTLLGNLSGSGTVTLQNTGGVGISEYGVSQDWSGFTGTFNYITGGSVLNFNPGGSVVDLSHAALYTSGTISYSTMGLNVPAKFGSLSGPSGYINNTVSLEIGNLNTSTAFGGVIQAGGTVTKVGTGDLTLSGGNTFTSPLTVENGSVTAGNNVAASGSGPFGTAAVALGDANSIGGNLSPSLFVGSGFTMARAVTVGSSSSPIGGTYTLGGNSTNNATFSGNVTLNQNLVVTQATGGTFTMSGAVSGSGSVTKTGAGVLKIIGTNSTYTGNTTISAGTLKLGGQNPNLLDRWSFNGGLTNSVAGGPAATAAGSGTAISQGSTSVTLAGGAHTASQYVSLGQNLLPGNSPVTIELWATMNSVQSWSRVFDFGSATTDYLMMPWTQATGNSNYRLEWVNGGSAADFDGSGGYTAGQEYHMAVVITPGAGTGGQNLVQVYVGPTNGSLTLTASGSTTKSLASMTQNNMWLGQSEFSGDTVASATYDEVRIWNSALSATDLASSHNLGPDALPSLPAFSPVAGAIPGTTNITVASGATFDVSAATYTLASGRTLAGNGTVTGAVTTASVTSSIQPGGAGVAGTLSFSTNLNLSGGSLPVFDLSTSHSSGNDQIAVGGNLTLNSGTTVHVNALGGSANLDQTGDYLLFSVAGTLAMVGTPLVQFDNTPPANAAHYTVIASGNNVVLHYSVNAVPTVNFVTVTNTATGTAVAVRGQPVTVYAVVSPGSGTITNVSADLSSIGGSASQPLTSLGGNNYSYTLAVPPTATLGVDQIVVLATDTTPLSGSGSANLTVNASGEVWNGNGAGANWSTGGNWASTYPPGYVGDTLDFLGGGAQTSPNMETNYNVAGLTFDASAGVSFTIGSAGGNTLTLTGGVTNNSSYAQTINAPIVLNGTQNINDLWSSGVTLGGPVSGSGGLTMGPGAVLTLAGANTYTGNTTIPIFDTLNVGNSAAIPSGPGKGNVTLHGALNLNGTNASMNGLNADGTVDNSSTSPVTLTVGNADAASTMATGSSIQNSGGALTLVKVGAGTLTLNSANSYSGGTTLSAGQITLGAGSTGYGNSVTSGPLGLGTVTLGGGTLQLNAKELGNNLVATVGTTSTIDNTGGDGYLDGNLSGSGTVTLQNSSGGGLSMKIGQNATVDWSGFTGTLNYNVANGQVFNVFLPTSFNLASATLNTGGSGTPPGSWSSMRAGGTNLLGALSGTKGYLDFSGLLVVGSLNTNTTFSGAIIDAVGITKVGTGTLTLSGANTYTGNTTISNGTLVVSTLSTGGGTNTVVDGATLGVSVISGGSLKVAALTFGNSTNNFSGLSSTVNPAITNSGALTLAGAVTVNVSGGKISVGQYPLIASASIGGTGGFVIGTLPWGAAANIQTNGNTIVLNVTTGSPPTFEWTGLNNTNWDLATANNWLSNGVSSVYSDGQDVQFDDSSAQTNVVVAVAVAPASVIVTNSARNYTFSGSGAITGSASLTKSGTGTLTLANTNSYSGGTVVNGGTLQLGDGVANNGVVAGGITDNGSLVFVNPTSQTFSSAVSGTGSVVKKAAGALTLGLNNTYSAGTTLEGGSVVLPNGATNAFGSGTLTLSNVTLVVKPNNGSDPYNSAQSVYIGNNVAVSSGTTNVIDNSVAPYGNLWAGNNAAQWTGSGTVQFQNNSGVTAPAVLWCGSPLSNFLGRIEYATTGNHMFVGIAYQAGDGPITTFDASGTAWDMGDAGNTLVQVNDSGCTSVKFGSLEGTNTASVLRYSTFEVGALNTDTAYAGQITAGALTKVGTGKLVLSGANTYTGATIISNGTLQVDGSLSTGAVTVYGTLAGQGTIGGASEVTSGGTLAPGDGIGTLTVNGNLTLDAGSTNLFEVNASTPTNDAVVLVGSVTYGGVLKIVPSGTFSNGQTFTLFSGAGAVNAGNFASIAGSPGAGLTFSFTNGVLSVASTVVISTNAYLTSLVVTPGTLTPAFTTNGYAYAFTNYLPNSSVTVTVTNADSTATNRLFFGGSYVSGLASGATSSALTLSQGVTNVVKVQVVAQDGVTTNNYTVNVTLQPNLSVPHLTNSVSGGTNLVLSWPSDHQGYRLLVQTNNLNKGVSGNTNDWGTVAGSQSITATNIAIIKTGVTNEYYKLVYP